MQERNELIAETFKEIGVKGVRALGRTVFLRTEPFEKKSPGGIYFPLSTLGFYDGPAHLRIVYALVIAAGPKCSVKVGDRVCFQRMSFARWIPLEDGTFVGWIDEVQMIGVCGDVEPETTDGDAATAAG